MQRMPRCPSLAGSSCFLLSLAHRREQRYHVVYLMLEHCTRGVKSTFPPRLAAFHFLPLTHVLLAAPHISKHGGVRGRGLQPWMIWVETLCVALRLRLPGVSPTPFLEALSAEPPTSFGREPSGKDWVCSAVQRNVRNVQGESLPFCLHHWPGRGR